MTTSEKKLRFKKALAISLSFILLISMVVTTGIVGTGAAIPEWQANEDYAVGDLVTYENKAYQCIAGHRSIDGWYPPVVPALWKLSPVIITPDPTATKAVQTPTPTATLPNVPNFTISGYISPDVDSSAANIKAGFKVSLGSFESITNNNGYFEIKSPMVVTQGYTSIKITKSNYLSRTVSNILLNANSILGSASNPIQLWAGDMITSGVQDNVINMADIMELAKSFNTTSNDAKYVADSDLNKDNAINLADIMTVVKHFNKSSADYSNDIEIIVVTPTPTPSSVVTNTTKPTNTPTSIPSVIPSNPNKSNRVISGYWETWDGIQVHPPVGHIPITDVPMGYNVINVAFPILLSDGTCILEDGSAPTEDVPEPAEVAQVKASGRKVLLSIGGAAAGMDLSQRTVADKFATTCIEVIKKFGFDGIDIDIETGLVAGPSWTQLSPSQENLIYIINKIMDSFGPEFMLTMAPETAYVTGGTVAYGNSWGGYLPVIDAVKDKLDWLQMQYYNGSMYDKNGTGYQAGTVEGIVKQTEALIDGFKIAGTNVTFSLPANKVVVGLPSSPGAGGGYAPPSTVQTAMSTLLAKYPNLRGLMTWSINWDASKGYEFVNNHRPFLDKYGNVQ